MLQNKKYLSPLVMIIDILTVPSAEQCLIQRSIIYYSESSQSKRMNKRISKISFERKNYENVIEIYSCNIGYKFDAAFIFLP